MRLLRDVAERVADAKVKVAVKDNDSPFGQRWSSYMMRILNLYIMDV